MYYSQLYFNFISWFFYSSYLLYFLVYLCFSLSTFPFFQTFYLICVTKYFKLPLSSMHSLIHWSNSLFFYSILFFFFCSKISSSSFNISIISSFQFSNTSSFYLSTISLFFTFLIQLPFCLLFFFNIFILLTLLFTSVSFAYTYSHFALLLTY